MITIFRKSQIDRERLREVILKNPDCLDPNLNFIDVDLNTKEGTIDLLGIDSTGQLVIVYVDIEERNEVLTSVLSQIHWLKKYESLLKRLFSGKNIDFTQSPQVYLVSSYFSEKLKAAVKQIVIQKIKLIQFNYLNHKDQDAIFFEEVFCTQEYGEKIRPTSDVKSEDEELLTFESTVISENKKDVLSPGGEEITLTPEEIAEFKDFDKTKEKEKT
jgi:hypothetical protein